MLAEHWAGAVRRAAEDRSRVSLLAFGKCDLARVETWTDVAVEARGADSQCSDAREERLEAVLPPCREKLLPTRYDFLAQQAVVFPCV